MIVLAHNRLTCIKKKPVFGEKWASFIVAFKKTYYLCIVFKREALVLKVIKIKDNTDIKVLVS